MKFYVVVHEERHIVFEAESEADVRHKFEVGGPLDEQGGALVERHDRIVSIEDER